MSLGSYPYVGAEVNPGMSGPNLYELPSLAQTGVDPTMNTSNLLGQGPNPAQNVLSAAAWAEFGQPPREYGKTNHDVNEVIQQQLVMFPWDDDSHLRIDKYVPLFVARNIDNDYGMHNVVSLAKLNEILRTSHQMFREMQNGASPNAEAQQFATYMEQYGEKELEQYHALKRDRFSDLNKVFGDRLGALEAFHNMATQPMFRYMTKLGILSHWNWWGLTINTGNASNKDPMYMGALKSESQISVVNAAIKGGVRMFNIAGDPEEAVPRARVWLVLRRTFDRNHRPAHFEIIPYTSLRRTGPPMHLMQYVDSKQYHRYCRSHVWDIGFIREPNTRNVPEGMRETAIGLDTNERSASQVIMTLPQVVVELGL